MYKIKIKQFIPFITDSFVYKNNGDVLRKLARFREQLFVCVFVCVCAFRSIHFLFTFLL